MMRRYFAYLLLLIIAVCIGLAISADPGYALFSYHHTTIEMPLWLACLFAIIVFIILVTFLRLIDNTRNLLHRFSYWRQKRKFLKLQQKTERDLLASLKSAYIEDKQWEKLDELLPRLHKHRLLSRQDHQVLQLKKQADILLKATEPTKQWQRLNRQWRKEPELINAYVKALIQAQDLLSAQKTIEHSLKQQWSEALCEYYGNLATIEPEKQLKFLEKYVAKHADSPALFAALGKICHRLKIWGKAKMHYQHSLVLKPQLDTYKYFGQLLEQLGESQEALKQYREALSQ